MFLPPKKSNKKLGNLLSTILTEPWYQKSLPSMLPTTSFTMRENANPFMVTPIICRLLSVDF